MKKSKIQDLTADSPNYHKEGISILLKEVRVSPENLDLLVAERLVGEVALAREYEGDNHETRCRIAAAK